MTHRKIEHQGTPTEWILTSIRVRDLARAWADRYDLSASVVKNGRRGSLANYVPEQKRLTLDADVAFPGLEPHDVGDLTDRMELCRYPVAGGMILHESMHARFTNNSWNGPFVASLGGDAPWTVFELLEEMRVESQAASLFPRDIPYLRASLKSAIMRDKDTWPGSARFAAQVILGRHWIGVLPWGDVEKVHAWLKGEGWSNFQLDEVKRITLRFAALSDQGRQLDEQVLLAKELDKIMPKDPPRPPSDSDDDGDEFDGEGFPEGLFEAIMGALVSAERGGMGDAYEDAVELELEKKAQEKEQADRQQEQNKKKADEVFREANGVPASLNPKLSTTRQPTAVEKTAAIILARELEEARYRERNTEQYNSVIPPGRLDTGEAMRRDAAIWAGASPTPYKPFKRKKRLETEEPTLTVGILCDTTGSMQRIQPGVGSAVWVISEAIYRTEKATAAQVYFGTGIQPGLRAGERLNEVRTWTGGGSFHDFDGGFRALDGELDLLQGTGARLLFVISDGIYESHQNTKTEKWMEACEKAGVAVIWLKISGGLFRDNLVVNQIEVNTDDLTNTASVIGKACVESLATASGVISGGW